MNYWIRKVQKLLEHIPRKIVLDSIRLEIDKIREKIKQGNTTEEEVLECINNLDLSIEKTARNKNDYKLRRVVNATGVVIHTNLGRSLINKKTIDRLVKWPPIIQTWNMI